MVYEQVVTKVNGTETERGVFKFWSKGYERNGKKRQEIHGNLEDVAKVVEVAKKNGDDRYTILPYMYEKAGEVRVGITMRTWKGTPKK